MSRDFDPVQLGSIELFCKAAELGSFTLAAASLGLTPAAVSRGIARLEARLQVKLFARSTRQIRLTDDGRLYFEQCAQALAQIRETERALSGRQTDPGGMLRISAPTTYSHYRLLPCLAKFCARYPRLKIEINISNRNIDFVDEGYDLAIRLGVPEDSRLVARKLENATLGIFAAPAYLQARGVPQTPDDLHQHACIQFVMPSSGRPVGWRFMQDGQEQEIMFDAALSVTDDVLGCVSLARGGGGFCQSYHFIVADRLQRGELVEVLQPYAGCSRPFSILYPHNRHLAASVRAFVDFMLAEIGAGRAELPA